MYIDAVKEVEQLVWSRKTRLFAASPVACLPEVLKAMRFQMFGHRSKEYQELHKDATLKLESFLGAEKATVLLIPSSGTGFMRVILDEQA
jgi:aspartate aminotransferase-like enzyme